MIRFIKKLKPYKLFIRFLEHTTITKYKLSLKAVLDDFFKEIINDDIQSKAQTMAFNFILAIFPGIIFLFNLIPYLPVGDYTNEMLNFMNHSMPSSIYDLLAGTIIDECLQPLLQ
jgi:membrane protein